MCRGGRMFAPTKTWRKWHVKVNLNQKRFATVSSLAASAVPALVLARGHRIEKIPEVPLVVGNGIQALTKTKAAVQLLKALGAYADVVKVSNSRKVRAGVGKMRNRRHRQRRGPLVVYAEDQGITKAFRNLPGVELAQVSRLNLLQLAPGGHLGRFIIWSQCAFEQLDKLYGTYRNGSVLKKGYELPQNKVSNPDITRIINSEEVRKVLRRKGPSKTKRPYKQKKNPLRNAAVMIKLNPYAQTLRRQEILHRQRLAKKKAEQRAAKEKKADGEKTEKKCGEPKKKKPRASIKFVRTLLRS